MSESEGRGSVWSGQETQVLLDLWGEKDMQKWMAIAGCRNKDIFKRLAKQLTNMGFHPRPWDRVRDKINRLKGDYRKIKDKERKSGEDSEESVMKPAWFDSMDMVLGSRPATRPSLVLDSGASSGDSLSSLAGPAGDEVKPGVTQHADEEFDAEPMDTARNAIPLQMAPHAEPLQTAPNAELRNEPASDITQIDGEPANRNGVPTDKEKMDGASLLNTSGTPNHQLHHFSSNEFDDIDSTGSQGIQVHQVTEVGWISDEDEIDCEEPRAKLRCNVDLRHHPSNPKRERTCNNKKDETVKHLVKTLMENNMQRDKVLMEAEDAHRRMEAERHTEEIRLLRDQIQLERERLQFERERLQFEREERERMELIRREEAARTETLRREEMERTEKARLDERDREERRFALMMALIKGAQNHSK